MYFDNRDVILEMSSQFTLIVGAILVLKNATKE
jgi:hypothetical protein